MSESDIAEQVEAARKRINGIGAEGDGSEKIAGIRDELQSSMELGAGIYREQAALDDCCAKIQELKQRYRNLKLDDSRKIFNTERIAALELACLLDCAEAVAESARARTESRGSHQRTDHPERNDDKFLKHSLAYHTDGAPRIEYQDVVITKWPPGDRTYGVGSGLKKKGAKS